MNVASLENCKELFELSGWANSINDIEDMWGVAEDGKSAVITSSEYAHSKQKIGIPTKLYPAYDLGYLLRKLPSGYQLNLDTTMSGRRIYWFETFNGHGAPQQNDAPEDAACKLAIKLFKQGILQKSPAS